MEIGVIGFGAVGQAFTKKAVKVGHKIEISSSRGPDSLKEAAESFGSNVTAVTTQEAANCKVVLLAIPWDDVVETLSELNLWNGQILIDVINPYHGRKGNFTQAEVGNLSTSQFVAQLAQGAKVVTAINNMSMTNFEADVPEGTKRVAFVSGDEDQAKQTVADLLEELDFYVIVLGNLRDGGFVQQLGGPLVGRDILIRV